MLCEHPDIENRSAIITTFDLAQQMISKSVKLDSDFKTRCYNLVDVIGGDEALQKEQNILMNMKREGYPCASIQQLITACAYSYLHLTLTRLLLRGTSPKKRFVFS